MLVLLAFGGAQYLVAQATGSAALMADALHRIVDPFEDLIVLARRWDGVATRVIGLLMIGSSVYIGFELTDHHAPEGSNLAVCLMLAAPAVGGVVWWLRRRAARGYGTEAARSAVAHARIDALGAVPALVATVMARFDAPGAALVDVAAALVVAACTAWVGLERVLGRSLRPWRAKAAAKLLADARAHAERARAERRMLIALRLREARTQVSSAVELLDRTGAPQQAAGARSALAALDGLLLTGVEQVTEPTLADLRDRLARLGRAPGHGAAPGEWSGGAGPPATRFLAAHRCVEDAWRLAYGQDAPSTRHECGGLGHLSRRRRRA